MPQDWTPKEEFPGVPPSLPRRGRRKRTPVGPSLLEMIKEEEQVIESGFDAAEAQPRKRRKTSLLNIANKFAKRALEPTTLKWHKCCRLRTRLHARKFREILDGFDNWTVQKSSTPPNAALTNENMKIFIVRCWEDGSRPNVEQAQKWLSHSLTRHGRPPLSRYQRQHYRPTLDLLYGISKEPAWREHRAAKTEAFDLDTCKKIFHASVVDPGPPPRLNLKALRNKALAISMIVNGWHPIDAYRVKDCDVVDEYGYVDRSGEHRPKLVFSGRDVHHTKKHSVKVRNVIGCGCIKNHERTNENCFYNVLKCYMVEKKKSDKYFFETTFKKLNKSQRAKHVDEDGNLRVLGFFRAVCRRGPPRCTGKSPRAPPREHGRQLHARGLRVRSLQHA